MSASNTQKTPFIESLQTIAYQKVQDAMTLMGKALPATVTAVNGSIVTVQFDVTSGDITLPSVTIAKAESQWIVTPTQVGDHGMVIPADVYMGGATGLGGGTADLSLPANLSALVWVPVANSSWTTSDANAALVQGPNGAIIRDVDSHSVIHLTPTQITITRGNGVVTITNTTMEIALGSNNVTINGTNITVNGNLQVNGTVNATGEISSGTHTLTVHTHGVTTAPGTTTTPTG